MKTIEERAEDFSNEEFKQTVVCNPSWHSVEKAYMKGADDQKELEETKLIEVLEWIQEGGHDMETLNLIDKWYNHKMSTGSLLELYKKERNE